MPAPTKARVPAVSEAKYISQRAANAIISEIAPLRISSDALTAINSFIDEFLGQLLVTASSLDLSRIKGATSRLLTSTLGKNAIVEAEIEVKNFTESGETIDYATYEKMRQLGVDTKYPFPIDIIIPQFREKCLYYCTLSAKESLRGSGDGKVPPPDRNPNVVISPLVAIYVTAIIEHIAEFLLTTVAKAAEQEDTEFVRVRDVFMALVEDEHVGKVFYGTDLKDNLEKRLFQNGYRVPRPVPASMPRVHPSTPTTKTHDHGSLPGMDSEFEFPDQGPGSPPLSPMMKRTSTATSQYSLGSNNHSVSSPISTSASPLSSTGRSSPTMERQTFSPFSNRASTTSITYKPTSVLSSTSSNVPTPPATPTKSSSKGFKLFGKKDSGKKAGDTDLYSAAGSTNTGLIEDDDFDEDSIDKGVDFEKLITSGQTMKVTLTPSRLRTIEIKDEKATAPVRMNATSWTRQARTFQDQQGATSPTPVDPNLIPKVPPMKPRKLNISPTGGTLKEIDEDSDDEYNSRPKNQKPKESIHDFLRNTTPKDFGPGAKPNKTALKQEAQEFNEKPKVDQNNERNEQPRTPIDNEHSTAHQGIKYQKPFAAPGLNSLPPQPMSPTTAAIHNLIQRSPGMPADGLLKNGNRDSGSIESFPMPVPRAMPHNKPHNPDAAEKQSDEPASAEPSTAAARNRKRASFIAAIDGQKNAQSSYEQPPDTPTEQRNGGVREILVNVNSEAKAVPAGSAPTRASSLPNHHERILQAAAELEMDKAVPRPVANGMPERPSSIAAKRMSLSKRDSANGNNISIPAQELILLRSAFESINSPDAVRIWDDFLAKVVAAQVRRRTPLNKTWDDDQATNNKDGVPRREDSFEEIANVQIKEPKQVQVIKAEISTQTDKQEEPTPQTASIGVTTDPMPATTDAATMSEDMDVPAEETKPSRPTPRRAPTLILTCEDEETGEITHRELDLSELDIYEEQDNVAGTEHDKGLIIGDEEWFLEGDEEWEEEDMDEMMVAEWLLGEGEGIF
ncbi:hypothetical protein BZG36_03085 [Bifiguratus adelaidae]|uniref:Uncharacterized protein n=1 Tax=Bifiguratus adelaidae TaxID=1938954 RepID=A0A261XZE5_9FUNG|nr:hypothetical protein BZG36_03085 [Bifiguratus adelaidae]